MDKLTVRKRGGGTEPWSYDKVTNSIAVSGVTTKEAEAVATLVEEWAKRTSQGTAISSSQVRNRAIEILRVVDSMAADAFEAYRK